MNTTRFTFRRLIVVLSVLLILPFIFSCATTNDLVIMGEEEPGASGARGWAAFVSDNAGVYIKKVAGGTESGTLRIVKGNVPIAIPCTPGDNEFTVYDKTGLVERLTVPVTEGSVTYVGIRLLVLKWAWSGRSWVAADYRVRCSVGTHPMPADQAASDPAPYFAALEDEDWATRLIAIGNLERINPPLDERQWNTLAALSREDSSAPVWQAAGKFFRTTRNQAPKPPMAIGYFDRYVYGLPLESNDRVEGSLVSLGYQMESKLEKQSIWEMLWSSKIQGVQKLEYALECSWQAGSTTDAFGMAVGYDDNNFNAFCVTKDGGAVVLAFRGGSLRSRPLEWRHDLADVIAASPMVRIGVSRQGAEYTMTVNGSVVGTFADKDMRSGLVGLFVSGRQTVVYNKIVVYEPPEPFVARK